MTIECEASEARTYALGRLVERAGDLEVELAMLAMLAIRAVDRTDDELDEFRRVGIRGLAKLIKKASARGAFGDQKTRVDAIVDKVANGDGSLASRRDAYIHGWWNPYLDTHRRIRDVLRDENFDSDRPFVQDDLDQLVGACELTTNQLNSLVEFMLARK